ncbi:CDP-glycerol glycerophosphotransferase family protein [Aeromonas sanarellii]
MFFLFKVLLRAIHFIVYYISYFFPKQKNLWVFGSFGIFNDNSRYFYEYVVTHHPEIRAVWISSKIKSIELAGNVGEAYSINSVLGFILSMRAKVFVFSAYTSDICWYTCAGAVKVNLWHGVPLKKIEYDINTLPLINVFKNSNFFSKFRNPHAHIKCDLVLSPSKYVAEYSFVSAFRLNGFDDIVVSKYPRVSRIESISNHLNYDYNEFTFLYAPTWRDGGGDFIKLSGIDFNALNSKLKSMNARMIVKLHPSTNFNLDFESFGNITIANNQSDPCELMAVADCLVTDYSSIYFDYLVLDRPIIFFPFDLDDYMKGRELYFGYETHTPGIIIKEFTLLLNEIENVIKNKDMFKAYRAKTRATFMYECENPNEVIFNAIIKKAK